MCFCCLHIFCERNKNEFLLIQVCLVNLMFMTLSWCKLETFEALNAVKSAQSSTRMTLVFIRNPDKILGIEWKWGFILTRLQRNELPSFKCCLENVKALKRFNLGCVYLVQIFNRTDKMLGEKSSQLDCVVKNVGIMLRSVEGWWEAGWLCFKMIMQMRLYFGSPPQHTSLAWSWALPSA